MTFTCRLYEFIGLTVDEGDGVRWSQYRGPEEQVCRYRDLPFGAMFIDTACQNADCKGPERGGCLNVKVPSRADALDDGQFWQADHPMSGGGYWSRVGAPPLVTATPSILNAFTGGYHGWLRDGQLLDA